VRSRKPGAMKCVKMSGCVAFDVETRSAVSTRHRSGGMTSIRPPPQTLRDRYETYTSQQGLLSASGSGSTGWSVRRPRGMPTAKSRQFAAVVGERTAPRPATTRHEFSTKHPVDRLWRWPYYPDRIDPVNRFDQTIT